MLIIACGALANEITALAAPTAGRQWTCDACRPSCTIGPKKFPPPFAPHPSLARELSFDFRRLRRLRHGRPARRGAARRGRRAHSGRSLLRVLCDRAGVRALAEAEPGTFYLTDFLLRHFDRLVIRGLGLDRHPELFSAYFGNYRKLVYLAQAPGPKSRSRRRAPSRSAWGWNSSTQTGYGTLGTTLRERGEAAATAGPKRSSNGESLIIISWRDIPAQVIVKRGRETAKVQLSQRFQEAVDRAAMRAGKGSSDAYLADWNAARLARGRGSQAEGIGRGGSLEARNSPTPISSADPRQGPGLESGPRRRSRAGFRVHLMYAVGSGRCAMRAV
jgi:hypothetical protein